MWLTSVVLAVALAVGCGATRNVLFIAVDDLRPEIMEGYGQSYMHTPNLDKLAKESLVFNRAYCQQAICGPTRNSFLSGRRPQRTQAWNFIDHFREVGPNWISFPQYFKEHNYTTLGSGKTYHPGLPPNYDEPLSWSSDKPYVNQGNGAPCSGSVCPANVSYDDFQDYRNLKVALDNLDYAHNLSRPFFIAYGAHKPHLPWSVPLEYWNMYDTESIALPSHQAAPVDMPPIAFTYELDGQSEIKIFQDKYPVPFPNGSTALPPNATRTMRRGYYSAVSWTDYCIGRLLSRLEELGHKDDTVVALVGDHGWQLGEHNVWGKHTNFELGTRVPLVIRVPGAQGGTTNALVESVDIYPTVAALAGLPPPSDVDGIDLSPLWKAPVAPLKEYVFSEYPRCPADVTKPWTDHTSCIHTKRTNFTAMGYSVRSDSWRYTVWLWWDGEKLQGDFTRPPIGEELYSHAADTEADFNKFENVNVASDPKYETIRKQHYSAAYQHWNKS